jgi:predicted component of type VI protein secretion system
MDVKLRVVGGKQAGQELSISVPKFLIGRAEGCHLRAKSSAIAERHCELEVGEALARVHDLGSPQGTFVNNERVSGSRDLKMGDHLKVGPLEFELCMSVKLAGKKKPKVGSIGEAAARLAGGGKDDLDLDDLLAEDDKAPTTSRYAAHLSDEEQEALGLKPRTEKPAEEPAKPAKPVTSDADETGKAAEKILNQLNKYKR